MKGNGGKESEGKGLKSGRRQQRHLISTVASQQLAKGRRKGARPASWRALITSMGSVLSRLGVVTQPAPSPSLPSDPENKLTIVSSRFDETALDLGQLKVRVEEADVGRRRGSRARWTRGGRCAAWCDERGRQRSGRGERGRGRKGRDHASESVGCLCFAEPNACGRFPKEGGREGGCGWS